MKPLLAATRPLGRILALAAAWVALGMAWPSAVPAAPVEEAPVDERPMEVKFVPYVGVAGFPDIEDPVRFTAGGSFRLPLLHWLDADVGICYRNTRAFNGQLHVSQVPITASRWLMPVPPVYIGGGAGWYRLSQYYEQFVGSTVLRYTDSSISIGAHVGGGMLIRIQDDLLLDLGGRYVVVDRAEPLPQFAGEIDPDSWSFTIGLAFELSGY